MNTLLKNILFVVFSIIASILVFSYASSTTSATAPGTVSQEIKVNANKSPTVFLDKEPYM